MGRSGGPLGQRRSAFEPATSPGFPRSRSLEANWAWAFVRNPGQTGRPAPSPVSPAIPVDPAGPRRDSDLLMSWNVCEPNTWCGHSCLPRRDRLGPPSSFHDRVKSYTPVRPVLSTPGPILPANATRSFSADTEHFWAFTLTALPIGLGSSHHWGRETLAFRPCSWTCATSDRSLPPRVRTPVLP